MSLIDTSESSNIYANELNYKQYQYNHSSYMMSQIFQQIGLPTVSLSSSGGPDAVFQLPVCAFNLYQSHLQFTMQPSVASAAGSTNWAYVDGFTPIRQLSLYDDQGRYYSDLYDVCNYTNMIFRYTTKFEEIVSYDSPVSGTTTSGTVASLNTYGIAEGLFPSDAPVSAPSAGVGIPAVLAAVGTPGLVTQYINRSVATSPFLGTAPTNPYEPFASAGLATGSALANSVPQGSTSYFEPQYTIGGYKATFSPCLNFRFPFKKLKHTIFGIDKTIYIGRILYLRIVWNSVDKIMFEVTDGTATNQFSNYLPFSFGSATAVVNGVATAPLVATVQKAGSIAGGVNITNLYMYLAKEQNILVENELKNKIANGGLRLLIPWVSQFKQNIPASPMNNITLRITNALGKRLLKIYWAPYNAYEKWNYAYDHTIFPQNTIYQGTDDTANYNAGNSNPSSPTTVQKLNTFYTMINNVRTTQYNLFCNYNSSATNAMANYNEDFDIRKNRLRGSCIMSRPEYYYNWVWEENFCDNIALSDKPLSNDQDNFLDGIDISQNEVKYDIFAYQGGSNNINVNYYVYICTLKELTITPEGITLL